MTLLNRKFTDYRHGAHFTSPNKSHTNTEASAHATIKIKQNQFEEPITPDLLFPNPNPHGILNLNMVGSV